MLLKGILIHFTNIMPCNTLICGSTQYKNTSESVKASVYISSLSLWCSFAGFLLLVVFPQSSSVTELSVTSTSKLKQVQKAPNCHQSEEGSSQKLCVRSTFFYPPLLPFILSLSDDRGALASFQHRLSGTAGFN